MHRTYLKHQDEGLKAQAYDRGMEAAMRFVRQHR
jgi:hypothetical protein